MCIQYSQNIGGGKMGKNVRLNHEVWEKLSEDCPKKKSYSTRINELLDIANNVDELIDQLIYIATPSQIKEVIEQLQSYVDGEDCQ